MIGSGPKRCVPQFQLLPNSHFGSAAEYIPAKGYILNPHSHVGEMNALAIVFPPRLLSYHHLRQSGVYVAVCEATLVMHDRRGHDAAMLDDFPVIDDQFAGLPDHFEFALVSGKLDGERAGFDMLGAHKRLAGSGDG